MFFSVFLFINNKQTLQLFLLNLVFLFSNNTLYLGEQIRNKNKMKFFIIPQTCFKVKSMHLSTYYSTIFFSFLIFFFSIKPYKNYNTNNNNQSYFHEYQLSYLRTLYVRTYSAYIYICIYVRTEKNHLNLYTNL